MKRSRKIISVLCAALVLASMLTVLVPVEHAYADKRQELQQQLSEAEQ